MTVKLEGKPYLKWKKHRVPDTDEVVHVLCVCIDINNDGDDAQTITIDFRGYIPDAGTGINREFTLCANVQVEMPRHWRETRCCCREVLREIVSGKGWLVVAGVGVGHASTEGETLEIPPQPAD